MRVIISTFIIMIFLSCMLTTGEETMTINPPAIPNRFVTDDGKIIHTKIVDIGAWNMDTTATATAAHGLGANFVKILNVTAFIQSDVGTAIFNLSRITDAADPLLVNGGISSIGDTFVMLNRRTGGYFDSVAFQSVAINRGYVVITYFE